MYDSLWVNSEMTCDLNIRTGACKHTHTHTHTATLNILCKGMFTTIVNFV